MPRKPTSKAKTSDVIPAFKTEAEEADWWASPAGRRYAARKIRGKIIDTEARTLAEAKPAFEEAKRTGGAVRFKQGLDIKRSDPAVIEKLMKSVRAKETEAISIRITIEDLNVAKRIAKAAGIGYQTVLKEIIHNGLQGS